MRIVACSSCHAQFDVSRFPYQRFHCRCGQLVDIPPERLVHVGTKRGSSCGASIRPEAHSCEYCGAHMEMDERKLSLMCPECFARNTEGSHFCRGCGVEFKPERMDDEKQDLPCPRCQTSLRKRAVAGHPASECGTCSGLWVRTDYFESLVNKAVEAERSDPLYRDPSLAQTRPTVQSAPTVKSQDLVYLKCPECRQVMHRKNFGRVSGVIIDQCATHGSWLDADELEAIARFILQGGMQRTREFEERHKPRAPVAAKESSSVGGHFGVYVGTSRGGFGNPVAGAAAERIIDFLDRLFR